MPEVKPMYEGLKEAYAWYTDHEGSVNKKKYMDYIDRNLM